VPQRVGLVTAAEGRRLLQPSKEAAHANAAFPLRHPVVGRVPLFLLSRGTILSIALNPVVAAVAAVITAGAIVATSTEAASRAVAAVGATSIATAITIAATAVDADRRDAGTGTNTTAGSAGAGASANAGADASSDSSKQRKHVARSCAIASRPAKRWSATPAGGCSSLG
jgi:hypothetical protein